MKQPKTILLIDDDVANWPVGTNVSRASVFM